jgi:integrase
MENSLIPKQENDINAVSLTPLSNNSVVKYITRTDGKQYAVRFNRMRFFYPSEWIKFFDSLKTDRQKLTFKLLVGTGARINEIVNIKVGDVDQERNTIILRVTKVKARKGEKNPVPRTISISSQLAKSIKSQVKDLSNDSYLPLLTQSSAKQCLKTHLKQVKLNPQEFSLHNIRKSHGNWLKCLGIDMGEICSRLGHDSDTYLKSYSSPDVFTLKDQEQMRIILGDLYQRRIKWA